MHDFFFQTYCLPTMKGKHQDLKSISPETVSKVIDGQYSEDIEEAIIVDCRYPYEYDGGHIQVRLHEDFWQFLFNLGEIS